MSIVTEVSRLQSAKTAIKLAIEGKGVTVPDTTLLDGMAALIESIEAGGGDTQIDSLISRTITEISNNRVTSIGNYAFRDCSSLTTADLPSVTSIGNYAFYGCSSLTTADLTLATSVGNSAFHTCSKLTALILRSETLATLSNKSALISTPISSGTGYIYVPSVLVDSYKEATNWATYANQIRAIEDYPEITGGAA